MFDALSTVESKEAGWCGLVLRLIDMPCNPFLRRLGKARLACVVAASCRSNNPSCQLAGAELPAASTASITILTGSRPSLMCRWMRSLRQHRPAAVVAASCSKLQASNVCWLCTRQQLAVPTLLNSADQRAVLLFPLLCATTSLGCPHATVER